MDFRAKCHVPAHTDSKRQSLHAKHHIYLGAEFQQSHCESLHRRLRASDPAQPHPRKLNAKWMSECSLGSSHHSGCRNDAKKRSFRGRNLGIHTKDWLIWKYVLMFWFERKNSVKHPPLQVCFPCGPILVSLSSFLGKTFSSFQGHSSEEVNRNPGLQRHLALESPEHFNLSLGRELGFTGEQSVEIDCRSRSHGAKNGCNGLDASGILDKCWSDRAVSACVLTKPLLLLRQKAAI